MLFEATAESETLRLAFTGFNPFYDLLAFSVAGVMVVITLIVRYTFRRGVPLKDTTQLPPLNPGRKIEKSPRLIPSGTAPSARSVKSSWAVGVLITFIGLAAWGMHHYKTTIAAWVGTYPGQFKYVYLAVFAILCLQMILAYAERSKKGNGTDNHYVAVIISAYNEPRELLRACIMSLFCSTRLPDAISIVNDGSTHVTYEGIAEWFRAEAAKLGIEAFWQETENRGKRHGQMAALSRVPGATIVLTIDSDGEVDPNAISELLKPFSNPKIKSVAGIVLTTNVKSNWLTRFTDLLFLVNQLTDRSSMSRVGSVLVNSGALAAYRAEIFLGNIQLYLNETFYGIPVGISDDSLAALFSLTTGQTVQQPSAFVFSSMPDNFSHHFRQQLRWKRGSFIRGCWRARYLSLFSWGFIRQALGWAQIIMSTFILLVLLVINPLKGYGIPWEILAVPFVVGYAQALRYWAFKRSDMSFWYQLGIYLIGTPMSVAWSFFVLRPLTFYSAFTCYKTGWGTRQKIEGTARAKHAAIGGSAARISTQLALPSAPVSTIPDGQGIKHRQPHRD